MLKKLFYGMNALESAPTQENQSAFLPSLAKIRNLMLNISSPTAGLSTILMRTKRYVRQRKTEAGRETTLPLRHMGMMNQDGKRFWKG
jgi:hypothetical protein